jgi:hypothetical protein
MGERERTWMILSCIWKFIEERHSQPFLWLFFLRLFTRWPPCVLLLLLAAAYLHNEPQRVSLFLLLSSVIFFLLPFLFHPQGYFSKKR